MDRRRGAYISFAMTSVGILGLAVVTALLSVPTISSRAPLALGGLFVILSALSILGIVWLLVIANRFWRDIDRR